MTSFLLHVVLASTAFAGPGAVAGPFSRSPLPPPTAAASPDSRRGVEPPPAADTTHPRPWAFGVDLAYTSSSGNENISLLTSSFQVRHTVNNTYQLDLTGGLRYGETHGAVEARNLRGGLKWSFGPEREFSPFLFATIEQDAFRQLGLRANTGLGANYHALHRDDADIELSLAALYSYEDHHIGGILPPDVAPYFRDERLSWGFKGKKTFHTGIELQNTTQYQPVWNAFGNYLLDSETTARAVVNHWLALTFGYTFQRNSRPLPGVKANDQLVRAGVSLQW
jgi:Protein of unknown function, DUF481